MLNSSFYFLFHYSNITPIPQYIPYNPWIFHFRFYYPNLSPIYPPPPPALEWTEVWLPGHLPTLPGVKSQHPRRILALLLYELPSKLLKGGLYRGTTIGVRGDTRSLDSSSYTLLNRGKYRDNGKEHGTTANVGPPIFKGSPITCFGPAYSG